MTIPSSPYGAKVNLADFEIWKTDIGGVFVGDKVLLRGRDILTDVANDGWMGVFLYGLTGKRFNSSEIELADKLWAISCCYPDPRIWNNRVAALGGSVRSPAGISAAAANAVSDAAIYGPGAVFKAVDTIYRASNAPDLASFVKTERGSERYFYGYGRPLAMEDERKQPLLLAAKEHGADGGFLETALALEQLLTADNPSMLITAGGIIAAVMLNLGLTAEQIYQYMIPSLLPGILFCHLDAKQHQEGTLFPLQCSDVAYCGKKPRSWPSSTPAGEL